MISDVSVTRRVGVISGERATEASSKALAASLALIEGLIRKNAAPVQVEPLSSLPAYTKEFSAFLLGHSVPGTAVLRELERPALLAAPFVTGGGQFQQVSHLLWAFEDSTQIRSSDPRKLDQWVETTCLAKSGIEALVRAAESMVGDHFSDRLLWVVSGFGELEDFAIAHARGVGGRYPIETVSIEQVPALLARMGSGAPPALLCVGRTAVPLGRFLGIQGWVGWSHHGFAAAQSWGDAGPALTLSFLLDRLGLASEARDLEKWLWESLRDPDRPAGMSTVEHLLRRLHG